MSDVFPMAELCMYVSTKSRGQGWSWHFTGHGMCDSTNDLLCNRVPAVCLASNTSFEIDCD